MGNLKNFSILICSASLILGGCSIKSFVDEQRGYELVERADGTKTIKLTDKERERLEEVGEAYQEENYVPVQDYTGDGFTLAEDYGADAIAERHSGEIELAVKQYLKDQYKTDVNVHNIVGTTEAATVFVESIGEPHFYTLVIVPIDMEKETVEVGGIWSLENDVEQAIITGLLAMIYDEEFAVLDKYLEGIVSEGVVTGKRVEALANVGANNYASPYYRLSVITAPFQILLDAYLENPKRTREEWQTFEADLLYDPRELSIAIELFMSEKDIEPNELFIDKIELDIREFEGLPRAEYVIYVHDNYVNKTSSRGGKENTLVRGNPDLIIKK